MHRRFLMVALSVFLSWMVAPALADTVVPTERVITGVNVRETPDGQARPVGMLRPGDAAEFIGDTPHRFHVRLSNGIEGYVSKSWTMRVPAAIQTTDGAELRLTFIDVGQGDATLVECPNGQSILVDAGTLSGAQEEQIQTYLLSRLDLHQRVINTLVITHPDKDHYSLLPDLLHDVQVDRIYRVGDVEDYVQESFREWLNSFPPAIITIPDASYFDREGTPNPAIDCGAAKVWILAASIEATESPANAKSIVLMIRYGDFEAVLTGDATHDTENAILGRYSPGWLDVDLLKIGHHGSLATSTSQQWVDILKPDYAVVSSGYENRFGHPRKEIIARVEGATIEVAPHLMRYAIRNAGAYEFQQVEHYKEAIYGTSAEGNVVVATAGHGTVSVSTFLFGE